MTAIFGTMEVYVVLIEWESDMDPQIEVVVASDRTPSYAAERRAQELVRERMKATVDEYDPDGCREFVLSDTYVGLVTPAEWLSMLDEKTTVPYVTIVTRTIPIQ